MFLFGIIIYFIYRLLRKTGELKKCWMLIPLITSIITFDFIILKEKKIIIKLICFIMRFYIMAYHL